jgi:chromate transporter
VAPSPPRQTRAVIELAGLFLRLGLTGFGGPAAHLSLMEQEVVRRRGWLPREEFLDLLGTVNLIPGPTSTEMAIFIGYRRCGWLGLLLGGACFILPATLLVSGIAWAYVNFGTLPEVTGLLYGIKPVIIAIIVQALWSLGRVAVKTRWLAAVGLGAAALTLFGLNALLVLFGTGFLTMAWVALKQAGKGKLPSLIPLVSAGVPAGGAAGALTGLVPFSLWGLFWFFLKVGSVLFGSGYVLLAFLRGDLVERWHWLSETQLLDAVAVGQFTPGPLFTTATFIGYILGGPLGALVATAGIFLPSFVLVAVSGPLVPRLRRSAVAGAFLDGVNVAALALMAVVAWQLGRAALVDWAAIFIGVASAIVLLRFRVNSAWLVLGGAALGLAKSFFVPGS